MHFSEPRLSCSKPTPPWTAWTSAGVHVMCNGSILNIGTNFICGILMKIAFQCPQTLLLQANLTLNCLEVCGGPCYVQSIYIQHRTSFICGTLMKNALQRPTTLLFQANLSLNCLDVCVGPCYVQWIHIQHRNKLYLWYINEKCTPVPPDSPVPSQPLPELPGRLQGSGLCVNDLYLSQEQTLLVVHQWKMHSSAPRLSCSKPTSPWTA